MDVQIPEMDGLEATHRIRELETSSDAHTPIVAMAAHVMAQGRDRCLAAGMDDYLSKPIQPEKLFEVIENLIRKFRKTRKGKKMTTTFLENGGARDGEVFDLSKVMEMVDGDRAFFKEIVDLFLKNLPEILARIREGIAREDAGALEQGPHSLKGSVGNLCAVRAYAAVSRLEAPGKAEKIVGEDQAFTDTKKDLEILEKRLRKTVLEDRSL